MKRGAAKAAGLLLLMGKAYANVMPMAFAGGDIVSILKECGEVPVRTVACVGASGSGKSTLMRSMFGEGTVAEEGLALMEASSDCSYSPKDRGYRVGTGETMISLAVSDVVIYNVLVHDLTRPEAMSDLQPALEELLSLYDDGVVDPEQQKVLVVAVRDCNEGSEGDVRQAVGNRLSTLWADAVKPEGFANASLEDVVSVKVACLPHHRFASDSFLVEVSEIKSKIMEGEPETPAAEVARLLQEVSTYAGPGTESVGAGDLRVGYQADVVVARCMGSFKSLIARMSSSFSELNENFGETCDGVVDTVLAEYGDAVASGGLRGGALVGRKQMELKRAMLRDLGARHAVQVLLLRDATMEKFRESLSGLRVTANVGKDMANAIEEADKFFATTAKGLRSKHSAWPTEQDRKDVKEKMREFASERLQLAKAQGAYIPNSSRKPVGVSFHVLLPKPFGGDAKGSGLTLDDPMAYTHRVTSSEPMFFEFDPIEGSADAPSGSQYPTQVEIPQEFGYIKARVDDMVHQTEDNP